MTKTYDQTITESVTIFYESTKEETKSRVFSFTLPLIPTL